MRHKAISSLQKSKQQVLKMAHRLAFFPMALLLQLGKTLTSKPTPSL
jgi:hypothetical protein